MMDDLFNRAAELQQRAEQLKNEQETVQADLRKTLANARSVAEDALRRVEQAQLEADYRAGDKTVVRDVTEGSGSGGYKRVGSSGRAQAVNRSAASYAEATSQSARNADSSFLVHTDAYRYKGNGRIVG